MNAALAAARAKISSLESALRTARFNGDYDRLERVGALLCDAYLGYDRLLRQAEKETSG